MQRSPPFFPKYIREILYDLESAYWLKVSITFEQICSIFFMFERVLSYRNWHRAQRLLRLCPFLLTDHPHKWSGVQGLRSRCRNGRVGFWIQSRDYAFAPEALRLKVSATSSSRSAFGITNSAKPQFKQTDSRGKIQTVGLPMFLRPMKWMPISPLNSL